MERLPFPGERLFDRLFLPADLLLERLLLPWDRLFDRLLLPADLLLDRLFLAADRLLDRLLLPGDLLFDRLRARAAGERLRLFLTGERDLDFLVLVRDLEVERLRRAGDRERLDLFLRPGLRDLDLFFLRSAGDLDFLLAGDLDLDFFFWDLEAERLVGEVEGDGCVRFAGDCESSICKAGRNAEGLSSSGSSSSSFQFFIFSIYCNSSRGVSSSLSEVLSVSELEAAAPDINFMSASILCPLDFSFSGVFSRAGELAWDCAPLDFDLDLETFLAFLGVFDLLLAGERDFVRCLLPGLLFLLPGDRDRLLAGDLDFERLRGDLRTLLDLERWLRFATGRDVDLLPRRTDRERDLLDLGSGDRRCRDAEGVLERLPPMRLTGERVLDRRPPRLDLERDFRCLMEREPERLAAAPRRGVRLRDLFVLPLDLDLDLWFLLGDCETDLRFGFFLGEGELLFRLGDAEVLFGLGDLDNTFLGVMERELERDFEGSFFRGLGESRRGKLSSLLGDFEGDREGWRITGEFSFEGSAGWLCGSSVCVSIISFSSAMDCCAV